jgi:hypothetical protein
MDGADRGNILSLEPKANPQLAREKCGPDVILMGGVDTATTLFMKDAATVKQGCEESIANGIQILGAGMRGGARNKLDNLAGDGRGGQSPLKIISRKNDFSLLTWFKSGYRHAPVRWDVSKKIAKN